MSQKVINLNDHLLKQMQQGQGLNFDPAQYTKNSQQVAAPFAQPAIPNNPLIPQKGQVYVQPQVKKAARRVPIGWAAGSVGAWCWCLFMVGCAWWWGGRSSIQALKEWGLPVDEANPLSNLWWLWQVGLSLFQYRVVKSLHFFEKGGWQRLVQALKYDKSLILTGLLFLAWDSGTTNTGFSAWAEGKTLPFGPLKVHFDMTQPTSITLIAVLSVVIAVACEPLFGKIWQKIKESWGWLING